jgi:hypothetical protein
MRLLVRRCIGNHWDDWEFERDDEPGQAEELEAEFFRECSYCGIEIHLCLRCRDKVFLCDRCFRAQKAYGKDRARALGATRERRRISARRRRLRSSA